MFFPLVMVSLYPVANLFQSNDARKQNVLFLFFLLDFGTFIEHKAFVRSK